MTETNRVTVYRDSSGEWRWRHVKSSDIIAESGEGYDEFEYALERAEEQAEAHEAALHVDEKNNQ
jgi:hypothetical protein